MVKSLSTKKLSCYCNAILWETMNHPESIRGSRRGHMNYTWKENIHYFRNGYEDVTTSRGNGN